MISPFGKKYKASAAAPQKSFFWQVLGFSLHTIHDASEGQNWNSLIQTLCITSELWSVKVANCDIVAVGKGCVILWKCRRSAKNHNKNKNFGKRTEKSWTPKILVEQSSEHLFKTLIVAEINSWNFKTPWFSHRNLHAKSYFIRMIRSLCRMSSVKFIGKSID